MLKSCNVNIDISPGSLWRSFDFSSLVIEIIGDKRTAVYLVKAEVIMLEINGNNEIKIKKMIRRNK